MLYSRLTSEHGENIVARGAHARSPSSPTRASHVAGELAACVVVAAAFGLIHAIVLCLSRPLVAVRKRIPPRSSQAEERHDAFRPHAPFSAALDASLRSAASLFADARFASMVLTSTLAAIYAYLAAVAAVLNLTYASSAPYLPCRIECRIV
eukprot:3186264-Pleurochrysis_carterae.AAC.1